MKRLFVLVSLLLCALLTINAQNDFPYKLNKSDYLIYPLGIGMKLLAVGVAQNQQNLKLADIQNLSENDVNLFDRSAVNYWNPTMDRTSNIMVIGFMLTPNMLALPYIKSKEWKNTLVLTAMYGEVLCLSYGLAELTKTRSTRPRPYLYNSGVSLAQKEELAASNDAQFSFYSLQTAFAFSAATYFSSVATQLYGQNGWTKALWIGSLTTASSIALMRYYSGQHFPTDIIAGALVGGLIGYAVPLIHKRAADKVSLNFLGNSFRLAYKW